MSSPKKMTPEEKAERTARLAQMQKAHFEEGQALKSENIRSLWGSEIRNYAVRLSADKDLSALQQERGGLDNEIQALGKRFARSQKKHRIIIGAAKGVVLLSFGAMLYTKGAAWPLFIGSSAGTAALNVYTDSREKKIKDKAKEIGKKQEKLDKQLRSSDETHKKVRDRYEDLKADFAERETESADLETRGSPSGDEKTSRAESKVHAALIRKELTEVLKKSEQDRVEGVMRTIRAYQNNERKQGKIDLASVGLIPVNDKMIATQVETIMKKSGLALPQEPAPGADPLAVGRYNKEQYRFAKRAEKTADSIWYNKFTP